MLVIITFIRDRRVIFRAKISRLARKSVNYPHASQMFPTLAIKYLPKRPCVFIQSLNIHLCAVSSAESETTSHCLPRSISLHSCSLPRIPNWKYPLTLAAGCWHCVEFSDVTQRGGPHHTPHITLILQITLARGSMKISLLYGNMHKSCTLDIRFIYVSDIQIHLPEEGWRVEIYRKLAKIALH